MKEKAQQHMFLLHYITYPTNTSENLITLSQGTENKHHIFTLIPLPCNEVALLLLN